MPRDSLAPTDPTPEQRRLQVAAILAQGVIRHRHCVRQATGGQSSAPREMGLEVVSETRLSVFVGFDTETPNPKCEVNDGRTA
jgi:hypothetical protein